MNELLFMDDPVKTEYSASRKATDYENNSQWGVDEFTSEADLMAPPSLSPTANSRTLSKKTSTLQKSTGTKTDISTLKSLESSFDCPRELLHPK